MVIPDWNSLSKEDQFYGIEHLPGGKWQRIDYSYDPKIRVWSNWFHIDGLGVVEFFDSFASGVYDFCESKNVRLERPFKENPAWMMQFYHPKEGLGRIDIFSSFTSSVWPCKNLDELLQSDDCPQVSIHSMWSSPNFHGARINKERDYLDYPISPELIYSTLLKHYETVCSWREPPVVTA